MQRKGRQSLCVPWSGLIAQINFVAALGVTALLLVDGTAAQVADWPAQQQRYTPPAVLPTRQQLSHVSIDSQLEAAVQRMDDPSFAVREQASSDLRELPVDQIQLYALLETRPLSAEQRYRILDAAQHRLLNTPRGAIGIRMDQNMVRPNGVGAIEMRITDLIAGFPAAQVLQVDDRITAVDGRPLVESDDLINRVQSKRPGDKVVLTVRRPVLNAAGKAQQDETGQTICETMEIGLELGSAAKLKDFEPEGRFTTPMSMVERARIFEAQAVAAAYTPRPRQVPVAGGLEAFGAFDVDDQPVIQSLIEQRQIMESVDSTHRDLMRKVWSAKLRALIDDSNLPNLSESERAFRSRVAERYEEIMRQ